MYLHMSGVLLQYQSSKLTGHWSGYFSTFNMIYFWDYMITITIMLATTSENLKSITLHY